MERDKKVTSIGVKITLNKTDFWLKSYAKKRVEIFA
jgi:hypothetical protein